MMKRAKGVMLAEIMAAIAWQTHGSVTKEESLAFC
jgi:hypothetical protein